jgi:hypothetical protein
MKRLNFALLITKKNISMKKLKLNLSSTKASVLTREQLKNILGGEYNGSGSCQTSGKSCDTQKAINCCSGLHCAEFVCRTATI